MRLLSVGFLAMVVIAGCSDSEPDDPVDPTAPTWYRDVAPILSRHCMTCHQEGGIAPFSMANYEVVEPIASQLLDAVESGKMPPWDARDGADCAPRHTWKNDPRLSFSETQVLRDWIAKGRLEGDVRDIPAPPTATLTGVTHTATPTTPYTTTGQNDEFVCFLLDPHVTTSSWVTGIEVSPGNPKVVHHTVTMVFKPGAALDAAVAANGMGQPFDCGPSVTGTADTYLLGVWTPGSQPFETSADLGLPIPAGAKVLMQMHYHPGGATTNLPDASTVRLRLTQTRPAHEYTITAVGNAAGAPQLLPDPDDRGTPEFRIPAGATNHAEAMSFPIAGLPAGARVKLFAAYPHMHYIGVGLQVQVNHAAATPGGVVDRECLVNVPRWNFDWQRTYQYDTALADLPSVGNGDVIDVRCTYDNSLGNPFVRRALAEQGLQEPVDVLLGEQSLDEMCLGIFGVVAN